MAKERSLGRGGLVAPLPRRYRTPLFLFITATLTLCGTVQSRSIFDVFVRPPNSLSVRARCIALLVSALYGLAQVGTFGSLNQTHSGHFDETCWRAASRDPSFRKNGSVGSGVKSLSFFPPRCSLFIYRGNLCWWMTTSSCAVGGSHRLTRKLFNGN